MESLKIIVMCCDNNADTFEPFYHCMEKYWPNHPEIIYSTETVTNPYYKTVTKNYPISQWTKRIRETVEAEDATHFLLMCDDIFIREPVDDSFIRSLCNYVKDDIAILSLNKSWDKNDKAFNDILTERHKAGKWQLSLSDSIWSKQAIIDLFDYDTDPWDFETKNLYKNYRCLAARNRCFINRGSYCGERFALHRGKWCWECKLFFDKEGIKMDYDKRGFYDKPKEETNQAIIKNKLKQIKIKIVLADRVTKAGDNAEYFYRYLKTNWPEIELKYVLNRNSADWNRLVKDNFNLIDARDTEKVQAAIDASSYFCFSYFAANTLPKVSTKYSTNIFLNHGVFYRILSYLTGKKDQFDLMIAGNKLEYATLLHSYGFPKNKIALTGQARHDSLILNNRKYTGPTNNILIQFWWRPWYKRNRDGFKASNFYKNVRALLSDKRIKQFKEKYNINFLFKLHVEMEEYRDLFTDIKEITFIDNAAPFEPLFIKSSAIITDFTSNVYEMALLNKPCIYFRPDWAEMNDQLIKKDGSSFDVKQMGIGPTTDTINDFFNELELLIKNNFKLSKKYQSIRAEQLTFINDTNCCERILAAILMVPIKSKPVENKKQKLIKQLAKPQVKKASAYLYF